MQTPIPLQWHIQQNGESVIIYLNGDLTRNTLLPLWKQRALLLSPKPNQQIYWDLHALHQIDSAGFVLLIEMLNHYQKQNTNCIIHTPETIKNLVELFDLSEWFSPFYITRNLNNGT